MDVDGLPVPFILHRGSNDMLAAIELCDYEAKDLNDAVMLGRTYFNYLNAMFIFSIPSAAEISLVAHREY